MEKSNNTLDDMISLLPLYVNGRLSSDQRLQIENWLENDPQAQLELEKWGRLHAAVQERPVQIPSRQVWAQVQKRVALEERRLPRQAASILAGIALALVALVVLWITVRPGVLLQWSISGSTPTVYRIYRANAGSQDFVLLGEVNSRQDVSEYSYLDLLFLPARSYVYKVEGITESGDPIVSQRVASQPLAALPGQTAILLASLLLGVLTAHLVRNWWSKRPVGFAPA